LVGLIQPQRDAGREQVAEADHVLARVLQRADDADADRPTLAGQRGYRCLSALTLVTIGLVGGEERELVDEHDEERKLQGRRESAGRPGELGGPVVHLGHGVLEEPDHPGCGVGVAGEQVPAE
jgi:hypothetical protein